MATGYAHNWAINPSTRIRTDYGAIFHGNGGRPQSSPSFADVSMKCGDNLVYSYAQSARWDWQVSTLQRLCRHLQGPTRQWVRTERVWPRRTSLSCRSAFRGRQSLEAQFKLSVQKLKYVQPLFGIRLSQAGQRHVNLVDKLPSGRSCRARANDPGSDSPPPNDSSPDKKGSSEMEPLEKAKDTAGKGGQPVQGRFNWSPPDVPRLLDDLTVFVTPREKGDIRDVTLICLSFAVLVYISQRLVCAYCAFQYGFYHN